MAVSSYADTTVGAVFFNITPSAGEANADRLRAAAERSASEGLAMPDRLRAAFGGGGQTPGARLRAVREAREQRPEFRRYEAEVWSHLETHHFPLMAHEWCHILQAIAYPALHLRCLRELLLCRTILASLAAVKHAVALPVPIPPEWREDLFAPTKLYRLAVDNEGTVSLSVGDQSDRRPNDLAEADLLEEDASIFQYKVECSGDGTAVGYSMWLRERGHYTMTFRFLSRVFGEAAAYFALPALVRTAFSTSAPMVAFASLVQFIGKNRDELPLLSLPLPAAVDGLYEVLDSVARHWGAATAPLRVDEPRADTDVRYLEASSVIDVGHQEHPIHELASMAWSNNDHPKIAEFLFHPARSYDQRSRRFALEMLRYSAPMTLVRIVDPGIRVNDTVYFTNSALDQHSPPEVTPTWAQHLVHVVFAKRLAFSLATSVYEDSPHNCHHVTCPLYRWDRCRQWPEIPDEFLNCSFPKSVEGITNHRFDHATGMLEPLAPGGAS